VRLIRLLFCLFLWPSLALAQTAVVARNVNLRSDPSTAKPPIEKLQRQAKLELLEPTPTRGFYHVRIADGKEGWVWTKNIRVSPEFATTAPTNVPMAISTGWKKYDPQVTQFTNANDMVCNDGGDDNDRTTYRYKDRTDTAGDHQDSYHPVSLAAMRVLPKFKDEHTKFFDRFTPTDKETVMKYEGTPVEVDAFLVANLRTEAGEATNCGSSAPTDVDWHLVLAESGQPVSKSVFAEITPRLRASHSNWKKKDFKTGAHLKIEGWLMYDPDHQDQMTEKKRSTLWEVHPITKIWKAQADGSWLDLDAAH